MFRLSRMCGLAIALLCSLVAGCDGAKGEVGLDTAPIGVSLDSAGECKLRFLTKEWSYECIDVSEADDKCRELVEEHKKRQGEELEDGEERPDERWYVIFVPEDSGEAAVLEFEPDGYLRVVLDGRVVQDLGYRCTTVALKPGARAEITHIAHTTKNDTGGGSDAPELPDPVLSKGFVGTWKGEVSVPGSGQKHDDQHTGRPRPIRIVIPDTDLRDGSVGRADLPRADYWQSLATEADPDDGKFRRRPAELWTLDVDDNAPRPVSVSRVYVDIGKEGLTSLTVLQDGRLYLEQRRSEESTEPMADRLLVGVLRKAG